MDIMRSEVIYAGKKYILEWFPGETYEGLENMTQVYGACFNRSGKLLVQQQSSGPWQIMGGTIEHGEKPEDTLIREVAEEANIEIEDIKYIGTQRVVDENGHVINQLRFAAYISKMNKRQIDPATGVINSRRFIDPDRYDEVSGWGDIGRDVIMRAKLKLGIKK